ncbi:MAG: hypothetical protein ACFFDP_10850 [Promethearchaeota archaeon]
MTELQRTIEERVRQIQSDVSVNGRDELTLLLDNIKRYLLEIWENDIEFVEKGPTGHPRFDYRNIIHSRAMAYELDRRIQLISEYQLTSATRIVDLLLAGINPPTPLLLTQRQVTLLNVLGRNPEISVSALTREISSTHRTIKQEKERLFELYGVHIASILDPHCFRLAHYSVHFHTKSSEAAQKFDKWLRFNCLDSFPFLLGFAFNVDHQQGYFTLYIPDQHSHLTAFQREILKLEKQFLEDVQVHRILGCYTNTSFDWYDYSAQEWELKADLHTVGTLHFIKEHGDQFPQPRGFLYTNQPIRFDQIDWIIATTYTGFPLEKSERYNILAGHGFTLSEKNKWNLEQKLKKTGTLFPYLTFSTLAFNDFLCYFIICSQQTITTLLQISQQLPFSRLHPTEKGAILILGLPREGPSFVKHMTRTLVQLPGVKDFTVNRCEHDIHLTPYPSTGHLWNSSSQLWMKNE